MIGGKKTEISVKRDCKRDFKRPTIDKVARPIHTNNLNNVWKYELKIHRFLPENCSFLYVVYLLRWFTHSSFRNNAEIIRIKQVIMAEKYDILLILKQIKILRVPLWIAHVTIFF